MGIYPIRSNKEGSWIDPPEKIEESKALGGLSVEEKARKRTISVWREIDKSCVVGKKRYLITVKSGPQTINDTQVEAMKNAIREHHKTWMAATKKNYPRVTELDIIIGLTYGTNKTTNNKENQILVKLLEHGFEIESSPHRIGSLIDAASHSVRVYRCVGVDFWAAIGQPDSPEQAQHVFLEILLALSKAITDRGVKKDLEGAANQKIDQLAEAIKAMKFPKGSLPNWMKKDFSEVELNWLASSMSAFFDRGI